MQDAALPLGDSMVSYSNVTKKQLQSSGEKEMLDPGQAEREAVQHRNGWLSKVYTFCLKASINRWQIRLVQR